MTRAQAEALITLIRAEVTDGLAFHERGQHGIGADCDTAFDARQAFLATVDPPTPEHVIHLDGGPGTACGLWHRAGTAWTTNPLSVTCPACKAKEP